MQAPKRQQIPWEPCVDAVANCWPIHRRLAETQANGWATRSHRKRVTHHGSRRSAEQSLDLAAATRRTLSLFIATDQQFELATAGFTLVLENGHFSVLNSILEIVS